MNIKWKILDEDKAKEYGLAIINADNDNTLLVVNEQDIPHNMSVVEFLELIIENGVVLLDKKQ